MELEKEPGKIYIFYCYAPCTQDKRLRDHLHTHLMGLRNYTSITLSLNHELIAGIDRDRVQSERFQLADIILLLISPDFVASEYHYEIVMRNALEKHEANNVRVVPILLRATLLDERSPLGRLQTLPKNGKPLAEQRNRDAALVDIGREVSKIVAELLSQKQAGKASEGIYPKLTQVIGAPCNNCGARNLPGAVTCENCGDLLLADLVPQRYTDKSPVLEDPEPIGTVKVNKTQQYESQFYLSVALVIDHSSSMKSAKIKKVREAAKTVIDRLEPTDYISVVIFDDTAQVIIPSMPANEKLGMKTVIDHIQSSITWWTLFDGGSNDKNTTMSLGIAKGLEELRRWNIPNAIKHMFLLTDGITYGDADRCRQLARDAATAGVVIHTVAIGTNRDKDLLSGIEILSGGTHTEFPAFLGFLLSLEG